MITAKWILITHLFATPASPTGMLAQTAFEDKLPCLETLAEVTKILEGYKYGVSECQPINHYAIGKAEIEKMLTEEERKRILNDVK